MRLPRRSAFTLIELLVSLGIIALLLAILLPVLSAVRHAARTTKCLANLQQWGASYQAYISGNRGKSLGIGPIPFKATDGMPLMWWEMLRPSDKEQRALLCPEADLPSNGTPKGPFNAWGPDRLWNTPSSFRGPFIGSYGFNGWLYATGPGPSLNGQMRLPATESNLIPVFFDCVRPDVLPAHSDPPLLYEIDKVSPGGMGGVAMRRHGQGINVVFLDNHAQTVPAEQLWNLKWSEGFGRKTVTIGR